MSVGQIVQVVGLGEFVEILAINESPFVGGIQNVSVRMADGHVREFGPNFLTD